MKNISIKEFKSKNKEEYLILKTKQDRNTVIVEIVNIPKDLHCVSKLRAFNKYQIIFDLHDEYKRRPGIGVDGTNLYLPRMIDDNINGVLACHTYPDEYDAAEFIAAFVKQLKQIVDEKLDIPYIIIPVGSNCPVSDITVSKITKNDR